MPNGDAAVEGWISTNLKDMEKDILEPEAFQGDTLSAYFQRGAPISSEHDTIGYPVGYLRKAVLVRDGAIIQAEDNPLYAKTDFLDFKPVGTGWYGLGTIDNPEAASNVRKGKVRSFSWIGKPISWVDLPDGGKHFKSQGAINPLLETTITAYPINQTAIMRVAKAHGINVEAGDPTRAEKTNPRKKTYSIPTQALMDLVMGQHQVQEITRSADDLYGVAQLEKLLEGKLHV